MDEVIVIKNTMSLTAPVIIFAIIFLSIIFYLVVTTLLEKREYNDMKKAKRLIEEGHKNAMAGQKNDGIYQETKRLRGDPQEIEEKVIDKERAEERAKCEEKIVKEAAKDLDTLTKRRFW